jgi:nitrite reductase/ring-hydroxylating ferredoxin subunit
MEAAVSMEVEPPVGAAENVRVMPPDLANAWLAPNADLSHQPDSREIRRKCIQVKGRSITLLAFADGRLFGVDSLCYHLGGPLGELGAIEDLVLEPGHPAEAVIACPWHGRRLRLSSGQTIDQHLDGRLFFSEAPAQRTYPAYIEADGAVHIVWSVNTQEVIPSDLVNSPSGPRTPISTVVSKGGDDKALQETRRAQAARRADLMKQRQLEHQQAAARLQAVVRGLSQFLQRKETSCQAELWQDRF